LLTPDAEKHVGTGTVGGCNLRGQSNSEGGKAEEDVVELI
jgi:hypothetical protein